MNRYCDNIINVKSIIFGDNGVKKFLKKSVNFTQFYYHYI